MVLTCSSTGWIAEVCKLNVVAQNRLGRPRKTWDEVLVNDRKKLGMDSSTLRIIVRVEDTFEEDMSNKTNHWYRKAWLKTDMMMMMIAKDSHIFSTKISSVFIILAS